MRILDYALAVDGGTQIITLETDGGEQLSIGIDGRMNSPVSGRQIFIGSSPESPDATMLPIGGTEECAVISLLEQWLDETQGFIRRENLMGAEQSSLQGQDLLDRFALEFLLEIKARDVN